ncbi:MAG: redox-sensitive bicupin YhaK (pirin superfamily) [Phycisphaerales bacterium]|jgi:redox-sensitive bicupin YhaK (pirin superfamily)
MLTIKESDTRGTLDHGWLLAKHSFSFGQYHDPANTHFRTLRVINEDVVAPGRGFSAHPHENMEILTYVLSGSLRHTDSLGHAEDLVHGQVQRMTAGSGIEHAEKNASTTEPVHLLQIWIFPRAKDLPPSHETQQTAVLTEPNRLHLIASPDGDGGSIVIQQDARMLAAVLEAERTIEHAPSLPNAWLQVARGEIEVNGHRLAQGDALKASPSEDGGEILPLTITATEDAEFVLFELA